MNETPANPRTRADLWLLLAFCGFLFFYGLGAFGLLGADEPRYAQVAREMLERSDWVTPTLLGKPWLEKPVLYYWEAMLSFRAVGVSDWAARVPSAVDAAMLIVAVYFFLRRFRPGSELDGALIAASCAGVVGFARAAATDMPLAACFSIALLAWYAWRESGSRIYLAAFYVFLALATLAKGPVAPALSGVIILLFIGLKRDWRAILGTLWIPGTLLYFLVMLPWYVAVQLRNPEFFRVFILEHNLARFSQDAYHHRQPFWFYLPVFLLAMMPWAVVFLAAAAERARLIWSEGKEVYSGADTDDSWALFLLIWTFVPVLFFSASQSKLPGYILPAVPAGALLVADYLSSRSRWPSRWPSRRESCQRTQQFFPALRRRSRNSLRTAAFWCALRSVNCLESSAAVGEGNLRRRCGRPFVCPGHGRCFAVALGPTVASPGNHAGRGRECWHSNSFRWTGDRRRPVGAPDCREYSGSFP